MHKLSSVTDKVRMRQKAYNVDNEARGTKNRPKSYFRHDKKRPVSTFVH